jgi:hypothetical protein
VLSNKDLDLPTQQELLAQFRCDEIAAVAMEIFLASSKAVRRPVDSGSVVDGLGAMMRDWLDVALGMVRLDNADSGKFDKDASRYHASVYQRKRADLVVTLQASLSPLFLGQLKNLHKSAAADFSKRLQDGLKVPGYDFAAVVSEAKTEIREKFVKEAKGKSRSWLD